MRYRFFFRRPNQALALTLVVAAVACTDNVGPTLDDARRVLPAALVTANPPAVFVGAGDIATCGSNNDEATAALIDNIAGTVFVVGDNAYENGSASDYTNCYAPTWGRHKARTKPVPGNHDYQTSGGAGYFNYFGAAAGTAGQGYYSFDLGAWHIIALNSEISKTASSPQMQWLRADLAAHTNLCTLAYWHEPLYSSTGGTGSGGVTYGSVRPYWDTLYAYGADLILNGHRHLYERLAPIRPSGTQDPTFGIREIIVGTGGIGHATTTNLFPASEVRNGTTYGVLKLYLYEDGYAWKFVPVAGQTFTDSASTDCHGKPGSGGGGGGVSASRSTVSAAPAAISASSGSGASTITVTAKDTDGNPVSGATVVLAATGSRNSITQPAGTTDGSGVATGTLSSTGAGPKTVSATIGGIAVTQTATVTVNPAAAAALAFNVQPANTEAGATIAPAVTVEIRDQFGNTVTDATEEVTVAIGTNPAAGTLTGTTTVAAVGGVAIFSTLSIDQPGTGYDLTAGASGLSPATSSAFDIVPSTPPVSDGQSTVSVSPATITASNGASASSITVTAKDANGNVVSGVNVTLSATGNGNTVTQPAGPTDGNGVATGALASTVAGSKTVTAVAGGVTLTQQPVVTVTASAPDAAQSTVSASPTTIAAGSGSSTLAVTAKDAFGNRISGAAVVLDATGTGNSLTQPNGPTNASGEATGSLASTDAEVKTVSATVDGTPVTQTAAVTVTPPAGAGIVHTLLTSGNNVVNQKIYTTASIAPAPSTLITVAVVGHNSTSAPGSPTVSGGGMSAWTEVTSVSFDSLSDLHKRVTIFRALSTGPGSGPITITFPVNVSNCQWIVSQWSGVDLSGTNGSGAIVQSASNRADGVNSLSVGLAPLGSFTNVAYGVVGVNGNGLVVSPGAGFEEIAEQSSGESPRSVLEAEWVAGDNTVNATWSGLLKAGILGVELKAAGGP